MPRMPDSAEQLDLLLLTVAKTRLVHQDGIRFQGHRYLDPTLAAYVKEEVLIRYDPADLAEIRVFYQDRFLCRAVCQELSGQTVSLKEIEKARSERLVHAECGVHDARCHQVRILCRVIHADDDDGRDPDVPWRSAEDERTLLRSQSKTPLRGFASWRDALASTAERDGA